MQTVMDKILTSFLLLILVLSPVQSMADANSARLAMEDAGNPLLLIATSNGNIYVEMLRQEAPNNVQRFMDLAAGEVEIVNTATNERAFSRYYDGMRFHRVLPGFIIQAGSPIHHAFGAPANTLTDEINADALGLNLTKAMNADGTFNALLNINSKSDFDVEILKPLYRRMGIDTITALISRQDEVLQALQNLTVKAVYENQGFNYRSTALTRPISRGVVALANQGPNTNGPEFFISLADAPWLSGKYTVIGKVVEGMEVVDAIGAKAIDPLEYSSQGSVILSISNIN